ncbi:MAG: hypothetical protein MUE48_02060 [Desulfobacterales bacterium]|jgi:hypothetical protein|nr:hypothetical protein [Desulfobacterales bacterium]
MKLSKWVLAALLSAIAAMPAAAHMRIGQPEVLKGLTAVRLEVERVKPEIERDGLFSDTLLEDMELRMRIAGMRLAPADESADTPVLYLNVDAMKCSFGYVYNIGLYLIEPATPARRQGAVRAITLRIPEQLGITERLSGVREAAADILDEFVKAWKKANAK